MTRAEQAALALAQKAMTWTDLLVEASDIADAYEQDFDNEATYFEYADGSVGLFLGETQEIVTYGSRN
jgi:hypothetical protein